MGTNPSDFSRFGGKRDLVKDISEEELKLFPVELVKWGQVMTFINTLNEREQGRGWRYRLPTQAEWEYACRGGATSEEECSYQFYFAQPTNDLSSDQANFDGQHPVGGAPKGVFLRRPTRVGAYPPNKLGLYDMHGNIWEWCFDHKPPNYNFIGRGGSWSRGGHDLVASQHSTLPELERHDIGFRLVRVPTHRLGEQKIGEGIESNRMVAMILEIRGDVQLHSTRHTDQKPAPSMLLYSDDRLNLSADAQVKLVFLSDLHKESVQGAGEVTVRRDGSQPSEAVVELSEDFGMTFVRLPKGTFYMGWNSNTNQKGVKTEILEDFEIAAHVVTQSQWQAVMGTNPSRFSRFGKKRDLVKEISDEELKLFPVEMVSREDAMKFIEKLNRLEQGRGWLYRLPTAAEWEYACRGGATTEQECSYHFYFDQPTNSLSLDQANFNGQHPSGRAPKGVSFGASNESRCLSTE